jgi:hypothetical protein
MNYIVNNEEDFNAIIQPIKDQYFRVKALECFKDDWLRAYDREYREHEKKRIKAIIDAFQYCIDCVNNNTWNDKCDKIMELYQNILNRRV